MATVLKLVSAFLAIIVLVQCQQADIARNIAQVASGSDKRPGHVDFHVNGGGSGNNGKNWGAGGSIGVGTKVWEHNRHSIGVGTSVGQHFGRYQGQSWHTRPNYGIGAGYTFKFGK